MDWYIGKEWSHPKNGLWKKVLDIQFEKFILPNLVSKVSILVEDIENLNGRPSKYLNPERNRIGGGDEQQQQEMEMGTALTPIDYYLELLVQKMIVGERSRCVIKTKADKDIKFTVTLEKILENKEIHKLSVKEMYSLAQCYKENGVRMFKAFPIFAHEYFSRAAKCLLSYAPFEGLSLKEDGVDEKDMDILHKQIQTNLAACLLIQQRYEDVIYMTKFVESLPSSSIDLPEKAIYRRAMAYFFKNEFEDAERMLEMVPNYVEKKDFVRLQQRIKEQRKKTDNQYKDVVKRMFNS